MQGHVAKWVTQARTKCAASVAQDVLATSPYCVVFHIVWLILQRMRSSKNHAAIALTIRAIRAMRQGNIKSGQCPHPVIRRKHFSLSSHGFADSGLRLHLPTAQLRRDAPAQRGPVQRDAPAHARFGVCDKRPKAGEVICFSS